MARIREKQQGFTLVELSVVLTIVAILLTTILAVGVTQVQVQQIKTTRERLNYVMNTVDEYVRTFGHIPCPADPTLAPGNAAFGVGAGTGDIVGGCTAANLLTDGSIQAGMVPIRELKLDPEVALDGWGNRLTYVVEESFTDSDGYTAGGGGSIEVHNEEGAGAIPIAEDAVVLILSHGDNEHGAWRAQGSATRIDRDVADASHEGENSHIDAPAGYDNIFVQRFREDGYDDLLVYRNTWQLAQ